MNEKTSRIAQEAEEITAKVGEYIPPFRLAEMLKIAGKIQNLIINNTAFAPTYRECKIVLSIVEDSIDKVTGLPPVAKGGK